LINKTTELLAEHSRGMVAERSRSEKTSKKDLEIRNKILYLCSRKKQQGLLEMARG